MLKLNQKIILFKFPFYSYTCVTDKMFKYSDKMCWLGKQHERQWLLEEHLQGEKKSPETWRYPPSCYTDFCLYYEHASWEITKKQLW